MRKNLEGQGTMMVFSDILKDLRESRNLTRQQLADATGLSVHTITSYEKGRREPNSKAMAALERYFQVSGEFLRGDVPREAFLQNSETIQDNLDKVISLFQSFKTEFDCSSQENQLLAVSILGSVMETLTQNLLYSDTFSDLAADEVAAVFSAMFKLNRQGRAELTKRAGELLQLTQYQR